MPSVPYVNDVVIKLKTFTLSATQYLSFCRDNPFTFPSCHVPVSSVICVFELQFFSPNIAFVVMRSSFLENLALLPTSH